MKAAFFHAPEPSTVRNVFYGRGAANRALWRAFAKYGSGDNLFCVTPDRDAALELRQQLDLDGLGDRTLARLGSPFSDMPNLGLGTMFRFDPNLASAGWTRRTARADLTISLCGLTHTLTPLEVMRWMGDCVVAPIHDWDALICTSRAGRAMVETLFEIWNEHLRERLGVAGTAVALKPAPLRLPVIPLGVHLERFAQESRWEASRTNWRARLGIGPDEVMVLFLGRLSYYEKAHPFALHRAVGRAAGEGGAPIHLVQAGRFPDPAHEELYRANAESFSGGARTHFVEGGDPDFDGLWAAADIFASLSDNLQETFGLTPVEAMAAGLPVVVSDWDGYRDTVEHGVTGFRVRTVMPPAGAGEDIGNLFFNAGDYHRHIGMVSQRVAVDIGEATMAIRRLADDSALRATMGAAGKARVASLFDWSRIVPQYEALWAELDACRSAARAEGRTYPVSTPFSPDPFRLYAGFPTEAVDDAWRLFLADGWRDRVAAICADPLNMIHAPTGSAAELLALVAEMGTPTVGALLAGRPAAARAGLLQLLVWSMKMGLLLIRPV